MKKGWCLSWNHFVFYFNMKREREREETTSKVVETCETWWKYDMILVFYSGMQQRRQACALKSQAWTDHIMMTTGEQTNDDDNYSCEPTVARQTVKYWCVSSNAHIVFWRGLPPLKKKEKRNRRMATMHKYGENELTTMKANGKLISAQ